MRARLVTVVAWLLLLGCQVASPSPAPTDIRTSPATTASPQASTASPSLTLTPTGAPTNQPSPGRTTPPPSPSQPLPTATGPASPPPEPSGIWLPAVGFPPPEENFLGGIVARPSGFVAVGSVLAAVPRCEGQYDGRVWISADGVHWSVSTTELPADISLGAIVDADGTLFAFGTHTLHDCTVELVVLRSHDGRAWQILGANFEAGAQITAVATAGATLVAVGRVETTDRSSDDIWISTDGTTWTHVLEAPPSWNGWDDVAAAGDLVVALSSGSAQPVWYSPDAGRTWHEADLEGSYKMPLVRAAASGDQLVVAGGACCGLPDRYAGFAFVTADGLSWRASELRRDSPEDVVATPAGFLAIGPQTWISPDGEDWALGPDFATPEFEVERAAASELGVIVATFGQAWFAPMEAVVASDPPAAPPVAEVPELHVRYRFDLNLHCGFSAIGFGFRSWVPDPPVEDTPPGFREYERGWLTQTGPNKLVFESRSGKVVDLRPSVERPWSPGCA